jgi:cob(I)alamin adenosyltransferase
VALTPEQPELRDLVLPYMNRLSDLLFTLARFVNLRADQPERRWAPQREREED